MKKYILLVLLTMVLLCCSCGNQPGADSPIISESSLPLGDPALYSWPEPSQPNQKEIQTVKNKFYSYVRSLKPNKMDTFTFTISHYDMRQKYITSDKNIMKKWIELFEKFELSGRIYSVPSGGVSYSFAYTDSKTHENITIFYTFFPYILFDKEEKVMLYDHNMDSVYDQLESLKQQMKLEDIIG